MPLGVAYDLIVKGNDETKAGLIEFEEADKVREDRILEAGLSNREATIV